MLRLEIPDEILVRAVTDAVERQLSRINDFAQDRSSRTMDFFSPSGGVP